MNDVYNNKGLLSWFSNPTCHVAISGLIPPYPTLPACVGAGVSNKRKRKQGVHGDNHVKPTWGIIITLTPHLHNIRWVCTNSNARDHYGSDFL